MPSPLVVLRIGSFVALVIGIVSLTGCESPPAPCFPVSGKVTFQKKPMTTGNVIFFPDASKGNSSKESAFGFIEPDGSYTLTTNNRSGAPLGWYKVSIDPVGVPKEIGKAPPPKGAPINPKYKKADTSGISIEVTENPKPGAYDIDLK
jgi:hypothetical protein